MCKGALQSGCNMEYEQQSEILKLPSQEYRRARGDIVDTFIIIH